MINEFETYIFNARVWLYKGDSPWHFVSLKKDLSKSIKSNHEFQKRGFGSIPVIAKIGRTSWNTSIFPDKEGFYILPIKKEIRVKESINDKSNVKINLKIKY